MYIEKFFEEFLGVKSEITKADVERLCKDQAIEHLYLEVKEDVNDEIDNLLKPFVAFANAKGGLLILGVEDKSKLVVGLDKTWDEQKITNLIRDKVFPDVSGKFQIIKTSDSNCYLIDIEPMPFLVGIKINYNIKGIKLKYTPYLYFIRNAHESRQMDPSLVKQVAIEKVDYEYNEDYRNQILDSISWIDQTYKGFGEWNKDCIDKEMVDAVKLYQDTGIANTQFERLKNKILNCQLKTISINIVEVLFEAYSYIIGVRESIKHKDNLTIAEDDAFDKLQDEFHNLEINISKRPTKEEQVTQVLQEQRRKRFIDLEDLSLLGFTNYYVNTFLEPYIKIKNIVYTLPKDKPLIGLLMNYENKLEDLINAILELCDSYNVPIGIKEDLLNSIRNEFPETFLKSYLSIMSCFENLRAATQNALYMEYRL